jgi:hypothetical protein
MRWSADIVTCSKPAWPESLDGRITRFVESTIRNWPAESTFAWRYVRWAELVASPERQCDADDEERGEAHSDVRRRSLRRRRFRPTTVAAMPAPVPAPLANSPMISTMRT